jgi:ribonucleoside-triphosphate reductase
MRDLAETYRTIAYAPSKDADIKRENANIDGESAMGAMLKYGSEGAKAFNLDEVLPEEFSKAHQEGWIHIHDLDFMTLTETCCQIDVKRLLARGFYTGHGFIRPPSSVKTAANLACIVIQSNQNDQHGGQSIPMLDYALAPYVHKSFVKNWRREAEEMLVYREGRDPEDARHLAEQWSVKQEPRLGKTSWALDDFPLSLASMQQIYERAEARTRDDVFQAMEALVHNLNTMQSRAGSQVPFSSVNYGTDTSPEGRLVSEMLLKATDAGLGEGETPIFPVQIFKIKDGVNYKPGDPNYDLFKLSIKVSAKRLYPNWESLDAPYNLQYYKAGDPDTEVATMGCRTRVMGNVWDPSRETTSGRGNLSFTTINLPRLGIEAHGDLDKFFGDLDGMLGLCLRQLLFRLDIQKKRRVRNYPFLMGEGVWMDSEKLGWDDPVGDILNHGTLSIGFIGLAECLTALVGKHHGEDAEARELGLRIVIHMRHWMDRKSRELKLNVTCLATPAEGLSGRFVAMDRKKYGEIKGVTDRDYYTNSFHVPVWYGISAAKKVDIEAPYHTLCNAGHITYIELDGDTARNLEAMESLVRYMHDKGCGYYAVSHPVDRDPVCGYVGVIGNVCPRCGRREGEAVDADKLAEIRKKWKVRRGA